MSNAGLELAFPALEKLYQAGRDRVRQRVLEGGKISAPKLDREQLGAHALAYLMTEYEASRGLQAWAGAVARSGEGGAYESLIAETYVAELVRGLRGGIDLGQTECIPLSELGIGEDVVDATIGGKLGPSAPSLRIRSSSSIAISRSL